MENRTDAVAESAVRAASDLRVVVSRLRRRLREVAETWDLTPSQTSALSRLSKAADGISTSALAAAEGVRPQSMAATLAVLDEHGLIQRTPDPGDGRRQLISLTEAGHQRLEGVRQARSEWLTRELDERFTEDERRLIIEAMGLLERLTGP
jgi:DNA-binding MarR family transcriptional regulator